MSTAINLPTASSRLPSTKNYLRMGFETMAAWDKSSTDFQDHIQKRHDTFTRPVAQQRSLSNQYHQPPSFRKATSQWSPPLSPTTAVPPPLTIRHTSLPATLTPPRSPHEDSAIKASLTPSLEEQSCLASKMYDASCTGDCAQISLLASLGASLNTGTLVKGLYEAFKPAKHGHLSPLAGAASHGQLPAAKLLISLGAEVNPHVNQSSSTPLHQACRADDVEMVRFLLSLDADVNAQNCYKTTPLMYAVKHGSPALVALILSYYPRLEARSIMETTAVHWAIFNDRPEALASLLRMGANPDARMADGSTSLHCTVMKGAEDMVRILIAFGADVGLRDGQDQTVIEVATSHSQGTIVELLQGARSRRRNLC